MQGYYFSKPVPPADFDRFLMERKAAKADVPPETRRAYMSISRALTGDFVNIFYVDMVTDCYLEFYMDKGGKLEIRPGGTDFFGDAREKLLRNVTEGDRERVRDATSKANLMRWVGQEQTEALSFRKAEAGGEAAYILQTIKTRESDSHHIMIGVRPE